jgi:hypothetical protein
MSLIIVALFVAATVTSAGAAVITNGDFEASPFLTGWNVSGSKVVAETTSPIAGATSARFDAGASGSGGIAQEFAALSDFVIDVTVKPLFSSLDRSLNLVVHTGGTGNSSDSTAINLKLAGTATSGSGSNLQVYNGSLWVDVPGATSNFFADNSVYRLQIVGHGWGAAGASYDVLWSDADSTALAHASTSLTIYQGATNPTTAGLSRIRFPMASSDRNSYLLDNVSVAIPTPAALPAGLALISALLMRRRK